jgi:hypothetical protein
MVIKGQSRAGPKQLALHLQRSDTNERVQILELQSALGNLTQALRDWQLLVRGTRGTKGMYHANIDPDARYAMTPELWQRAADVLEQELGLIGQPRVIVLHEKKGREHIHIVWQRTNVDTMTLVPDSNNYYAHERASLSLETEFGHEHVPGKHAKRDWTKPPPKAEFSDAEWQQAERTGADPRARKSAITGLYEQSDGGQAFRAALSGAGYILAKGDRRDYVIVDEQGEVHSLARQIKGVTAKDLRAFMADIDRDSIPNIEQAKALQREIAANSNPAPAAKHEPSPPALAPEQLAKIKIALQERDDEEGRRLRERQERERTRTDEAIDRENAESLDALDALHHAARSRFDREHNEERGGLHRFVAVVMAWISPAKAARERERNAQAREEILLHQHTERTSQVERLNTAKKHSLVDLFDRHEQQRREHAARYEQELVRFTRDHDAAQRLIAEIEQRHRQQELAVKQQPASDVPAAVPPRGPTSSRFLKPEQRRFLKPQVATPPTRLSRFITTTADGVAIPPPTAAPPVTASRFITEIPETPNPVAPQYFGLNSKFLRPREDTPQPTATGNSKPSQPPPMPPRPSR